MATISKPCGTLFITITIDRYLGLFSNTEITIQQWIDWHEGVTFYTINILLTKTISKANGRLVFIAGAPIGIDSRRWKKNKRKSTNHGFHAFNIVAYIVISYVTIFLHMWLCVDCVKGNWQKEEQQITAFMCVYSRQSERKRERGRSEAKRTGNKSNWFTNDWPQVEWRPTEAEAETAEELWPKICRLKKSYTSFEPHHHLPANRWRSVAVEVIKLWWRRIREGDATN